MFVRDIRPQILNILTIWRSKVLLLPVVLMLAYVSAVVFGNSQIDL
jgi:hypothetical protein